MIRMKFSEYPVIYVLNGTNFSKLNYTGHPFVGRRNEYQRNGSDALRLGSKGRYGWCVGGR